MNLPGVRWWNSLRTQIALSVAGVTLIALGIVAFAVDYGASIAVREQLRTQVTNRLDTATTSYVWYETLSMGAKLNDHNTPHELRAGLDGIGSSATFFDGEMMWAARQLDDGVLSLPFPADSIYEERSALRQVMLVAALPAVAVSAALAWGSASGLSSRLRATASQARRISNDASLAAQPGILSLKGKDEVSELAKTIDTMATTLAHRFQIERQFSADVAHELRTPVTALVSATELLDDSDINTIVRRQALRLQQLVHDLLELFRAESSTESIDMIDIDLETWIRDYLVSASEPIASADIRVTVDGHTVVHAEPRRLDRVVTNLIINSLRHGDGPVQIVIRDATLTVADRGQGFPEQIMMTGPRRFLRDSSAPGSGLGLTIVSALMASMSGQLTLANGPDGGAHATISFDQKSSPTSIN